MIVCDLRSMKEKMWFKYSSSFPKKIKFMLPLCFTIFYVGTIAHIRSRAMSKLPFLHNLIIFKNLFALPPYWSSILTAVISKQLLKIVNHASIGHVF